MNGLLSFTQDEEHQDNLHASLNQLLIFRDLVRKTGLRERAKEVGWVYGDSSYFGMGLYEIEVQQLTKLCLLFDFPVTCAYVSDFYGEDEGHILRPVGDASPVEDLTEDDLLVGMTGGAREIAWFARAMRQVNPGRSLYFRDEDYEGAPETLAEALMRREAREGERDSYLEMRFPGQLGMHSIEIFYELNHEWTEIYERRRDGTIRELMTAPGSGDRS